MRKIINKPETVVLEMCNGIILAHPELELVQKYKIIKKKNIDKNKVSLISGGGSGHEPSHVGYIGKGMLDAAVCGEVFASPSQIQVYQAIKETASDKGTLLIVKNYSGDIMNFKSAANMAIADGIRVDYVKVDDDIAVQDSLYTVGRRGVAGTVLVHKVAGAAAEQGLSLAEVKKLAENVIKNVKTIGFAYSSCTVPAKGSPTFDIFDGEMEYGVGIHGEPGIKRESIISADDIAEKIVNSILKELPEDKETVTLLINGFGSTPLMELYLFNNSVQKALAKHNINVYRTFVGNFMTSIDMLGASISILKMKDELKIFIDAQSDTPAFKVNGAVKSIPYVDIKLVSEENKEVNYGVVTNKIFAEIKDNKLSIKNVVYIVDKMAECIIKNEVPFCELDSHAGDGDFGMSLARGFKQLKREWDDIVENTTTIGDFLKECSFVIMEYCGGASGPIWSSAFRSAGKNVGDKKELTIADVANMLQATVKGIQSTGEVSFGRGAVVGDKTLIDALVPCADKWSELATKETSMKVMFEEGAKASVAGAKSTENIVARMGRASTVGERSIGYPDAGAHALGVIFTEIANCLK